jgi:glutathione S-transferase
MMSVFSAALDCGVRPRPELTAWIQRVLQRPGASNDRSIGQEPVRL